MDEEIYIKIGFALLFLFVTSYCSAFVFALIISGIYILVPIIVFGYLLFLWFIGKMIDDI